MKLFRYRPLSELLFKELLYQELYFSSFPELNDPLDLTTRLDFTPADIASLRNLTLLIVKCAIRDDTVDGAIKTANDLIKWSKDDGNLLRLEERLHSELATIQRRDGWVSVESLLGAITLAFAYLNLSYDTTPLHQELTRLVEIFLEGSLICSFSETPYEFLMWSHYASKHSGICLEFDVPPTGLTLFLNRSCLEIQEDVKQLGKVRYERGYFPGSVDPVIYTDRIPTINFFDFAPILLNEHNADVMGLSKPWTHNYAAALKTVFKSKLSPWAYEREWRVIQLSFGKPEIPEERISQYPINVLTGICFGIRTPGEAKHRIFNILKKHRKTVRYRQAYLNKGQLEFYDWYADGEHRDDAATGGNSVQPPSGAASNS